MIGHPCIDMREGPSRDKKVVSQALFGEKVDVLEERDRWLLIQTPDKYTGWVMDGVVKRKKALRPDLEVTRVSAHVYALPDTEFGPLLTLPFGSKLELIDNSNSRWHQVLLPDERVAYIQKGDVEPEVFALIAFSKKFLGLPYVWGGRSSFGFDCSGFIQMLYSRLGVQLPRDARQQIEMGRPIEKLLLGDLIFWGHTQADIRHVGMFLEGETFIHTSVRENKPYLRLSKLSDQEWSGCEGGFYPFRTTRRIVDTEGIAKLALRRKFDDRKAGSNFHKSI